MSYLYTVVRTGSTRPIVLGIVPSAMHSSTLPRFTIYAIYTARCEHDARQALRSAYYYPSKSFVFFAMIAQIHSIASVYALYDDL